MTPTAQGSFRFFQAGGVTVYVHWSWFLVAAYEFNAVGTRYRLPVWHAIEYLTVFAIILLHEFGHVLACRQVGGKANQIVLWPFGGVAYVSPPQRPGATLWSIAAGPLVNVALIFVLTAVAFAVGTNPFGNPMDDARTWIQTIWWINIVLLVFNLLPIYPLDGGQILRSLLWFVIGRAKSLLVAASVGFAGVVLIIAGAALAHSIWIGLLSVFMLMNCWRGLSAAMALLKLEKLPRHVGFACPRCQTAPQVGAFWICGRCNKHFDTFQSLATCPHCGAQFEQTRCINCGADSPLYEWAVTGRI